MLTGFIQLVSLVNSNANRLATLTNQDCYRQVACEQAPGEDGKNFGERETEEFGEQSDRSGDRTRREPVRRLIDS